MIKITSKIPDIHVIDGKYYNWNGKNPDKPLTIPYGKRLLSLQKRFGGIVDTKTASGHGGLTKKKSHYEKIAEKKDDVDTKKSVAFLGKTESEGLMQDIRDRKVDTKNLRTRFRSGFRVYQKDDEGNVLDSYDVYSYSKALDGVIPLERFLKEIPDDAFQDNVRGGFKIVVYDKVTHEVHYSYEYGEQD